VLLTDLYQARASKASHAAPSKTCGWSSIISACAAWAALLGSRRHGRAVGHPRVLGTVPVEADGSAHFKIPAQTPVMVQPLDENGQALQTMRSWFTGMPGESVSCVGCHAGMNEAPPPHHRLPRCAPASDIDPSWHGPSRGFNFAREVQPVLDRHCVQCHAGGPGHAEPYLKGDRMIDDWSSKISGNAGG
jgi:hypothetical protein